MVWSLKAYVEIRKAEEYKNVSHKCHISSHLSEFLGIVIVIHR